MRTPAYPSVSGTFLPKGCIFARDAAESSAVAPCILANPPAVASVEPVVVAPPHWARTQRLIRYPSPCRRSCVIWRRPPLFRGISKVYIYERRLAHSAASRICDLDSEVFVRLTGLQSNTHSSKGTEQCDQIVLEGWPSLACWALPPAVVQFPSRRFSAQARVQGPLRYWTAALPPARSSARRATSPTAKPTRTAVDNSASRHTSARKSSHWTIGAARAGGLFMSCRRAPAPGQEPKEGTPYVQEDPDRQPW